MLAAFRKRSPVHRPEGLAQGAGRIVTMPPRAVWAESIVATEHGNRPLRSVLPGDHVATFDDHDVPVAAISRGFCRGFGDERMIQIAPGAIGNRDLILVSEDQRILVESDEAEAATGDPFALVAARDLLFHAGVTRIASDVPVEMIALHFEQEQVVPIASGALMHCVAAGDADAMGCLLRQRATAPRYAEMPELA